MKLENAQRIVKAAEDMGLDVTLREGYSGRGMYGKTTAGVIGCHGDIIKSIAYAAAQLGSEAARFEDDDSDADFIEDMDLSMDNMGLDYIFY